MGTPEILQTDRLLYATTPLGDDVLLANSFSGSESLSAPFSFHVELLADLRTEQDKKVKASQIVGKKFGLKLARAEAEPRYFHGLVRRFERGARTDRFVVYHAEVVPWLWLLTLTSDCRIFQSKSVPEILAIVFGELHGMYPDLVAYRDETTGDRHPPLDYCVQYRETGFQFVSRLMEQAGIFYYFEHAANSHTLVMADSRAAYRMTPQGTLRFTNDRGPHDEWIVPELRSSLEMRPGAYTLRDYYFEDPGNTLEKSVNATQPEAGENSLEVYDYPGGYASHFNEPGRSAGSVGEDGNRTVDLRMKEEEARRVTVAGVSPCRGLMAGRGFELREHPQGDLNGRYLLTGVHHVAHQTPPYLGAQNNLTEYENSFTAIPWSQTYVPRRATPKPVVQGPQTAVVTVKSGEESWLDKYGRVRVQFPWDRKGRKDETSACWVRVAQPWAGAGWGAHFWPRAGQEVVVEFLEGNPDQPIVTGSVYNAGVMPPYALPGSWTRSGIQTRSAKGGASNYNELRFEDKKGAEQIFMNAERDYDLRAEHDWRSFVGNDRHSSVQGNERTEVGGDRHADVKGELVERVAGDVSRKASMNLIESVGQGRYIEVGTEHHLKVGTNCIVDSGMEVHLKSGMKLVLDAGMQISINAGGSFISLGPDGITIQGLLVRINSGGAQQEGSPVQTRDAKTPAVPDTADDGSKGGKL